MGPVTRIGVPAWAPAHAGGLVQLAEGFGEVRLRAAREHRDAFLALLHITVESYLHTMSFEDGFPRRDRLTGEYYIGSEYYASVLDRFFDSDFGAEVHLEYRVNFCVRCLQWPRPPHQPETDDYLGLDVDIRCDPVAKRFYVYACDSSVI